MEEGELDSLCLSVCTEGTGNA